MAAKVTPRLDVCQTAQQTAEVNAFDCTHIHGIKNPLQLLPPLVVHFTCLLLLSISLPS